MSSDHQESEKYEPRLGHRRLKVKTAQGGKRQGAGQKPGTRAMKAQRLSFPEMGKRDAREFVQDLNAYGIWEHFITHPNRSLALKAWLYLNDRAYGRSYMAVNPELFGGAKSDPSSDPRMSQLMNMLRSSAPVTLSQTKTVVQVGTTPESNVVPQVISGDNTPSALGPELPVPHPSTQKPPTPEVGVHSPAQFFQKNDQGGNQEKGEENEKAVEKLTLEQKALLWDEYVRAKRGHRGKAKLRTKDLELGGDGKGDNPTGESGAPQKGSKRQEEAS